MVKESRTNNVIKNTSITIICHIIFLISSFICRTIFSKKLGTEYLGIGGLFSNILTILSFAELGLGSSLVYRLYKPFAEEDYNKINLYLKLYKKIYNIIIFVILLLGVSIIPFLKYLVDAPNVKESLILLYLLYLVQTATTYLFVYKKTLLTANQKDYIVTLFNETSNVIMNILQCFILIFFKNFILYLLIMIICGIVNNVACSIYVDKKYKFLNNKIEGKLRKKEIDGLKQDTKGLVMTKVASTAFSGTDNIFISSVIGIKYVGILSNYTLLLTTINTMMNKIFSSITASIGNLAVSNQSNNKTENVLFKMFFVNTTLYTYICLGLIFLIREFVTNIWLNKDYYLSSSIIFLAIFELYLRSIHYPLYTTRNALGLFSQKRKIFVFAAILNIVLDFLLVKPLGITGLILATIICRSITYFTDIYIVYKYGLEKSSNNYYKMIAKWFLFASICYFICYLILRKIVLTNILIFVIKILVITAIYGILFFIFFRKAEDMKYFRGIFKNKIFRKKEKV